MKGNVYLYFTVNLLNQRKNKTFKYTPKHQREQQVSEKSDLASQWEDVRRTSKRKKGFFSSLPVMVLFLIAIFILFYILSRYE